MTDRRLIAAVLVALAAGWWLGSSPASPIAPQPQRPVIHALARITRTAARLGLWMAFAAEPPQEQRDPRIVQHAYDAEGHRVVDHGEGW